jgi:hypothetical protein
MENDCEDDLFLISCYSFHKLDLFVKNNNIEQTIFEWWISQYPTLTHYLIIESNKNPCFELAENLLLTNHKTKDSVILYSCHSTLIKIFALHDKKKKFGNEIKPSFIFSTINRIMYSTSWNTNKLCKKAVEEALGFITPPYNKKMNFESNKEMYWMVFCLGWFVKNCFVYSTSWDYIYELFCKTFENISLDDGYCWFFDPCEFFIAYREHKLIINAASLKLLNNFESEINLINNPNQGRRIWKEMLSMTMKLSQLSDFWEKNNDYLKAEYSDAAVHFYPFKEKKQPLKRK